VAIVSMAAVVAETTVAEAMAAADIAN